MKGILIIGAQGTGKTTKMLEIVSQFKNGRVLWKDEANTNAEIEQLYQLSEEIPALCILTTQLELTELSETVREKFDIISRAYQFSNEKAEIQP